MATVPDIESISHFPPALQYGLYAIAFIVSVFMWWRGTSAKPREGQDQGQTLVEICRVLERMERSQEAQNNVMQGCYRMLGEMRNDADRHGDENNQKLDTIADIGRDVVRNTDRPRR